MSEEKEGKNTKYKNYHWYYGRSKAKTFLVLLSVPEHSSWSLETKEQAEWVGTFRSLMVELLKLVLIYIPLVCVFVCTSCVCVCALRVCVRACALRVCALGWGFHFELQEHMWVLSTEVWGQQAWAAISTGVRNGDPGAPEEVLNEEWPEATVCHKRAKKTGLCLLLGRGQCPQKCICRSAQRRQEHGPGLSKGPTAVSPAVCLRAIVWVSHGMQSSEVGPARIYENEELQFLSLRISQAAVTTLTDPEVRYTDWQIFFWS